MEYLNIIMTWVIALNLILAGIGKLTDVSGSARVAVIIGVLPPKASYLFGSILPFLEIIIGITLIFFGANYHWITWGTLLLFFSFLIVNIKVIIKDIDIGCNCYGSFFPSKLGKDGIFNNILLIIFNLLIIFTPSMNYITFFLELTFLNNVLLSLSIIGLLFTSLTSKII